MLDKSYKTCLLLGWLKECLPFEVTLPQSLIAHLARKDDPVVVKSRETVEGIYYHGDMGGIMCQLLAENGDLVLVSLTQVQVDRLLPCSRDVYEYQKHRRKRIKKGFQVNNCPGPLALMVAGVVEGWCDMTW